MSSATPASSIPAHWQHISPPVHPLPDDTSIGARVEMIPLAPLSPDGKGMKATLEKAQRLMDEEKSALESIKRPRGEGNENFQRRVKPRTENSGPQSFDVFPLPRSPLSVDEEAEAAAAAFFKSLQPQRSLIAPPTPAKKSQARRSLAPPLPQSPFQICRSQANSNNAISINEKFVPLSQFGRGSYMDVFRPTADRPLINGVPNEKLLVKLFNQERCNKNPLALKHFMENSLKNYQDAREIGLPVAKIFNAETALTDGYLLQELVPSEIDLDNPEHIDQVHAFFIASLHNKLPLDLLPGNLRLREGGVVTLIDFVEEQDEDLDTLEMFISNAVSKWTAKYAENHNAEQTTAFFKGITKGFEHYGFTSAWEEDILKAQFAEKGVLST